MNFKLTDKPSTITASPSPDGPYIVTVANGNYAIVHESVAASRSFEFMTGREVVGRATLWESRVVDGLATIDAITTLAEIEDALDVADCGCGDVLTAVKTLKAERDSLRKRLMAKEEPKRGRISSYKEVVCTLGVEGARLAACVAHGLIPLSEVDDKVASMVRGNEVVIANMTSLESCERFLHCRLLSYTIAEITKWRLDLRRNATSGTGREEDD